MALGSRLRRLCGLITDDAARIYDLYGVELDPRWFPVFYVLSEDGPRSVTQIAHTIGHSHASVSQIVKAMTSRRLVTAVRSRSDRRVRLLHLTDEGWDLVPRIESQYRDVSAVVDRLLGTLRHDLWEALRELEDRLDQEGLYERARAGHAATAEGRLAIADYRPEDAADFYQLNLAWIVEHFELEDTDRRALEDPEGTILEPGGHILMARWNGENIGSCALIRHDAETLELAKMTVSPAMRGHGVGWLLARRTVAKARQLRARRIYLESNTKLAAAIHLYRRLGFREVERRPSPYARCNIQMELELE